MNSWVWACTPGVMRGQDVRRRQTLGVQRVEPIELVEAVDHDVAHAGRDRHAQLVDALVVAVHHGARRRHAGCQGDVQLAAAGHVEQHALVVGQAGHRPAEERLRGVHRLPWPNAATASRQRARRWASS